MRATILLQGSVIRAAYGVLALFFPKILFGSIGMRDVDVEARYLNRLFGGRDLTIAATTLAAVRRGETTAATALNLSCEITDTISLVQEIRTEGGLRRSLWVGVAFNLTGYITWIRALLARPPEPEAGDQAV